MKKALSWLIPAVYWWKKGCHGSFRWFIGEKSPVMAHPARLLVEKGVEWFIPAVCWWKKGCHGSFRLFIGEKRGRMVHSGGLLAKKGLSWLIPVIYWRKKGWNGAFFRGSGANEAGFRRGRVNFYSFFCPWRLFFGGIL